MGTQTKDDIKTINTRWLGNDDVILPNDGNVCYACPLNKERNAISTHVFADLVEKTCPSVGDSSSPIPTHCIIIESTIRKGKSRASESFHAAVFDNCGDADVVTGHNKKVDPALKFYNGIFLMINTNKDLSKGRANGTLCRGLGIKLKDNAHLRSKNWDGKLIPTVSVDDIEYMLCEHYEDSLTPFTKFKLYPEKESVKINLKLLGNMMSIGGVSMTQFAVNSTLLQQGTSHKG